MKKVLDQSIISSFKAYLDYRIQKDLEGFYSVSEELTRYDDPKFSNKVAYAGSSAGWCYDDTVSGITQPQISGFVRGQSGMSIDFVNGRVLFDKPFPAQSISAEYVAKEANIYISSNSEYKLIFETKFEQSPVLNSSTGGYIQPYSFIAPCIFIKSFETHNEPFAIGGEDWGTWNLKVICLMDNESNLYGVGKVIRDSRQQIFPLLQNFALNQYGDLKDLLWNYPQYCEENQYYAFISDSTFKIEEPDIFTSQNSKLYMGIGNIEVRIVRQPGNPDSDPNLDVIHALTDIDDIFDTDQDDQFILT